MLKRDYREQLHRAIGAVCGLLRCARAGRVVGIKIVEYAAYHIGICAVVAFGSDYSQHFDKSVRAVGTLLGRAGAAFVDSVHIVEYAGDQLGIVGCGEGGGGEGKQRRQKQHCGD